MLEGFGCQRHARAVLTPGMNRCLSYGRLGGLEVKGDSPENLASMGFEPRTVNVWTSRYTDYVIPDAKYEVQSAT